MKGDILMSFCAKCANQIPDDAVFCVKCGAKVERRTEATCERCGAEMPEDMLFCPSCGTKRDNTHAKLETEHYKNVITIECEKQYTGVKVFKHRIIICEMEMGTIISGEIKTYDVDTQIVNIDIVPGFPTHVLGIRNAYCLKLVLRLADNSKNVKIQFKMTRGVPKPIPTVFNAQILEKKYY